MRKNKHLLLWSSLATLWLLVIAAVQENVLKDWRQLQAAAVSPDGPIEVRLRQIVVPALGVTDRCVTCHVGMAAGEPTVASDRVLKPHPPVVHDPTLFGCTTCHGGQGLATETADAHGDVHFWPEPMLTREYAYAGCGTCHTHLQVPSVARLQQAARAFERADCLACHRLDGRGGTLRPDGGGMEGPNLSLAGAKGFQANWYDDHRRRREADTGRLWTAAFPDLTATDRDAIDTLLKSRVGAPRLVEAKALFQSLGCRGCHKVNGVGGDDGPDLTEIGMRDPGRLDFTYVPGPRAVSSWIAEHFRAPQRIVPGSLMPELRLSEEQISLLTFYMLSLRRSNAPEAFWPTDRLRAERFGEREFATDPATIWGGFCAACHGQTGQGRRYAGMPPFPAVASPDFLALASDEFLRETVRRGRPGRRMPPWDTLAGLRPAEIDALVAYMRELGGGVALEVDPKPVRWVKADARAGEELFSRFCATCHGPAGAGGEGPSLVNPVLLDTATDTYLVETIRRGRRGTSMESFLVPSAVRPALSPSEIESVVAFLRASREAK